jgi:hypothetical protein
VRHYILRSVYSLVLFRIRKNYSSNGRSLLLYQLTRRVIKLTNYWGISLLSTSYEFLFNILPLRLSPYVDQITGDHHCEFQCNISSKS